MDIYRERIETAIKQSRQRAVEQGWTFQERAFPGNYGDLIDAVFGIDNDTDARAFYEGYVTWLHSLPPEDKSTQYTEEQVAKANIGWAFGEGMADDRRAMWVRATGAAHPIFGTMETRPEPEEAFAKGFAEGVDQALRRG